MSKATKKILKDFNKTWKEDGLCPDKFGADL